MLTGRALLDALETAPTNSTEADRMRLTGYTFSREGQERLKRSQFYKAVASAVDGGRLVGSPQAVAVSGRPLSFETSVLAKGQAVIGQCYLRQIGLRPGDRVRIVPEHGALTLERA